MATRGSAPGAEDPDLIAGWGAGAYELRELRGVNRSMTMIIGPSCTPLSLARLNPALLRGWPRRRRSILQRLADAVRALTGPAPALARR